MDPTNSYDQGPAYLSYGQTLTVNLTDSLRALHTAGMKIAMIKAFREVSNLGLKEAKDLVDGLWMRMDAKVASTEATNWFTNLTDAEKVTIYRNFWAQNR